MTDKAKGERQVLLTEVNKVLVESTHTATNDRTALRDAVCAYLEAEAARGTTLKSVIRTVKQIVSQADEAGAGALDATGRGSELAQQLVDWCAEFHRKPAVGRM